DIAVGNVISGAGSFVKAGTNKLTLGASHTYRGPTFVSSGTLALANSASISTSTNIVVATAAILSVTGRSDRRLTLSSGQTLSGSGAIAGDLVAGPGSTIRPGDSLGTLSISGSATLQGIAVMELNAPTSTSDQLVAGTNIAYGGTLNLTNVA